ncbi:probable pre-mRNA-splicing factor ATP-dependent RNA helicase DEAH4, partial [Tanacetum coccineum]
MCVGYASQLAERMMRHNGYRTVGFKSQLVQVHPSSVLRKDDEGVFPNYVVYHELIVMISQVLLGKFPGSHIDHTSIMNNNNIQE